MTPTVRIALAATTAILALADLPAQATEFTRLDVVQVVNQFAKTELLDADDFHLDIETVRIPRSLGDLGKVCGPIVPLSRNFYPNAKRSFAATLWIDKGQLAVGGMSTFFGGIDELMASELCR